MAGAVGLDERTLCCPAWSGGMGHRGGRGAAVGVDGVIAMGPGAVEVMGAALGMEHAKRGAVVRGGRVDQVWMSRGLLDGRHHGPGLCRVCGATGEALGVHHRGQVVQRGTGAWGRAGHGATARRAGRIAPDQAGVSLPYRQDGSQPGLAVEGLPRGPH